MRVEGFVVGFPVVGLGVPVVVGLRVVDLHVVGLAVVSMMLVMGTSVPPPQTQRKQAIFAVDFALPKPTPYKEHCVLQKNTSIIFHSGVPHAIELNTVAGIKSCRCNRGCALFLLS